MNKKALGITAGALAAVLLAGGGGYYALTSGSSDIQLTSADITTAAKEDLISSVSATGTVAAERELSLTTSLTGPIQSLEAKVGDRVDAQQLLGRMDTTDTERELEAQRTAQEAGKLESVHQIEDAQLQLRQLQESLDQGLNQRSTAHSLQSTPLRVSTPKRRRNSMKPSLPRETAPRLRKPAPPSTKHATECATPSPSPSKQRLLPSAPPPKTSLVCRPPVPS